MKKFNLNNYMYIQITEIGWQHLRETVGDDYIKHCINTEHYRVEIEGEIWYRLQAHQILDVLPNNWLKQTYNLNVMFDESALN